MFGHRPDGKLVKTKNGLYKLIPHVMDKRVDSQNFIEFDVDLDTLDTFIKEQQSESGVIYTYFDILLASIVRIVFLRPELNRFVVNKRIYQRDGIYFSLAVQKTLKKGQEDNETTLKIKLNGNENIGTIKDIIDSKIKLAKSTVNETDKFSKILGGIPYGTMSFAVSILKWMDKHGILPKSVMDSLPFHTTFFITDLKSVGIPSIYHHVYEFGTTGLFFSTGKEKLSPYKDKDGNIQYKRVMPVKFVSDERFCDGYYFSISLRMLLKVLNNPKVLLKDLEIQPLPDKKSKKKSK